MALKWCESHFLTCNYLQFPLGAATSALIIQDLRSQIERKNFKASETNSEAGFCVFFRFLLPIRRGKVREKPNGVIAALRRRHVSYNFGWFLNRQGYGMSVSISGVMQ